MPEDSVNRKRGGRPPKPEHEVRKHRIEVWLSDMELADLEKLTEQTAASRADIIRALIGKRRIKRLSVPEVSRSTYVELGKIGGNINQLAKGANRYGYADQGRDLDELHQIIQAVRREIMGVDDDSEA